MASVLLLKRNISYINFKVNSTFSHKTLLKFTQLNILYFPCSLKPVNEKRLFSTFYSLLQVRKEENTKTQSLVESANDQVSTHVRPIQKAKQVAKDTSYGLIVAVGGVLLVAMFYYLFTELFSRETPSGLYNESSKICLDDFEVRDALGTPIKVTAESGGRRVFQIK